VDELGFDFKRHKSGQTRPHPATRAKLTRVAANFAKRELEQVGFKASHGELAALCGYISIFPSFRAP